MLGWTDDVAHRHVEIALAHPIKLIANALGSPPKDVIDRAHEQGVQVRRPRREGAARTAARQQRRRHHRRTGLRGRRPHRRDRHDGPRPRGRRRGRSRPRCSRPAASARGRQIAAASGPRCPGRVAGFAVADDGGERLEPGGARRPTSTRPRRTRCGHAATPASRRACSATRGPTHGRTRTDPARSACRCRTS